MPGLVAYMWNLTPAEVDAIRLSLKVCAWAVAGGLPPAIGIAWLLARRQFPGKQLLNGLVHLPLVVPPVVTGYVLLLLLGRHGPIGAWLDEHLNIVVAFRWTGAVIAAAVMGFPLIVRAIRLSFEAIDVRLEEAASSLGASPLWVFLTVTLPLALPGVLAGAILGFAKALGEFGATITFVSNIPGQTRTLPQAIYTYTQVPDGQTAALRLATIAVVLALGALLASELLARRMQQKLRGCDAAF